MRKIGFELTLHNLKIIGNHIVDTRNHMEDNEMMNSVCEEDFEVVLQSLDKVIEYLGHIDRHIDKGKVMKSN